MIVTNYSGRTANNLFQYVIGRIVADHFDSNLTFNGNNHIPGEFNCNPILNRNNFINNMTVYNDTVNKDVSLEDIFNTRRESKIILVGYWQKSKFYTPYRNQMKQWFALPESRYVTAVRDTDMLIHIRREDYILCKSDLNFSYYDECIRRERPSRVFVTGNGIDQFTRRYFTTKYNCVIINESPIEDFKLIKLFKRVVLSNSTFCWMASFLSDKAEKVYFPEPVSGYWSKLEQQNLFIDGFHTKIDNIPIGN